MRRLSDEDLTTYRAELYKGGKSLFLSILDALSILIELQSRQLEKLDEIKEVLDQKNKIIKNSF